MKVTISHRSMFFVFIVGICTFAGFYKSASAETKPQIQELQGLLENDQSTVYTLSNLKKGDTLYGYMTNISGNLDPMLGLFKKGSDADFNYKKIIETVANSSENMVDGFSQFADSKFIVWDDDSGKGYDARLKFSIPTDGDYVIFAGSMITNLSLVEIKPTFTYGGYRLLLGLNSPDVENGKGQPTGKIIATLKTRGIKVTPHV